MSVTRRALVGGIVALTLTSCDASPDATPTSAFDLRLGPGGLVVPAHGQAIDFGRAEAGAVAAVTKLLGSGPTERTVNGECGAGPSVVVTWASGLSLLFRNNALRGWSADGDRFRTVNGFSPGQTRAELEAAGISGFRQTTLGTEATLSRGIFALLDGAGPDAKVRLLWAGTSCFFR